MRRTFAKLTCVLLSCGLGALAAGVAAPAQATVRPGQIWTLDATTAEGEVFRTTLHLNAAVPSGNPLSFRADRGVLIVDTAKASLLALDLADTHDGGLALACAYSGPLQGPVRGKTVLEGVLAAATLKKLPSLLEAALAVVSVARTPKDRAEAARELHLGTCTLTLAP